MTSTTRVTVLMLTYNRPQTIGRAVASVCSQSFSDWELVIVQDGNNPETSRLLSGWLQREPRIRYFPRGTVGTIAEASNFGLAKARGEYVAILDDDDYWISPDKLRRQVDFLDEHPQYVGCGGGYVVVDQDGHERGAFVKPVDDSAIRSHALLANPVVNSTALFRRVVDGEPVAYDCSMKQFADWDFWLSLGAHGKLYNFPQYLTRYALWEGGSSFQSQRANGRAALRIVRKHRQEYTGYTAAISIAWLYYGYSMLPEAVRRVSYTTLSALKKNLTATHWKSAPARPARI